jgi:hypothetical protein
MAKTTSKPAGKMAVKAGPSGKMHKFQGVGTQAADTTAVKGSGASNKFGKLNTGGSGKMHKFAGVKPVKPA